jgi:pimeloyl-ACP methyl ester carboxylesterase
MGFDIILITMHVENHNLPSAMNIKPGKRGIEKWKGKKIRSSKLPTPEFNEIRKDFNQTHTIHTLEFPLISSRERTLLEKTKKEFWREQEDRSMINLYEREQLRDLLIDVRRRHHQGFLTQEQTNSILKDVHEYKRKLDIVNIAMPIYNPDPSEMPRGAQFIQVETPRSGQVGFRIATLDVRSEQGKNNFEDIQTIFLTGWSADFKSPAAFTQALAITSNRPVITFSMPEHYTSTRPDDWSNRLKETKNNVLHAEVFIAAIKKLGFHTIDLGGYSAGGSVALTMAALLHTHPELGIKIRNLDAFNVPGFESKNLLKLIYDFTLKTGVQAIADKPLQRRGTIVQRGVSDFRGTGSFTAAKEIMTRQHFLQEDIVQIKTSGRSHVFLGDKDPVASFHAANMLNDANNPNHETQIIQVKGGNHGMLLSKSAFFAEVVGNNLEIPPIVSLEEAPSSLADLVREKYATILN